MTLELDENGHYITKTNNSGDPSKVIIKLSPDIVKIMDHSFQNLLEIVFRNGKLIKEYAFDEVRKRAEIAI